MNQSDDSSDNSSDLFNLIESMSEDYIEKINLSDNQNKNMKEIVMKNRRDSLEYLFGHPEVSILNSLIPLGIFYLIFFFVR